MKPFIAGLLTVAILGALLFLGSREGAQIRSADPQRAESPTEPEPVPAEEAVRRLIRCGDEGDVTGYLQSFSGTLRDRLEREVAARGREAFANDLKRSAGARKGHAVFAAEPEVADAARVVVEMVYPDRNERQTYRVVRSKDDWRVAEVATVRSRQPSERFGTSANAVVPEGTAAQVSTSPKVGLTVETGADPGPP
jgi:hypothetical protein